MPEDAIECIDEKSIGIYEEVSWSGSGIWEHGENRRWVVVNNHILPNLVSTAGESSLVGGLGMGPYVQNFEQETETEDEDFRIVTSGSTMMRLCAHTKQITSSDTIIEELAPATTRDSGVIPESTPIIANIELMREDDSVPGPSSSHPRTSFRQTSDVAKRKKSYSKSFIKAKKKQRRKRKQKRNSTSHRRIKSRNVAISVESSPGRKSPSPSTLEKLKLSLDTRVVSPKCIVYLDESD